MKEFEPYLVKFEKDITMKAKTYPSDCKLKGEQRRPIIVIPYDEYTFLSNDDIRKA